MYPFPYDSFSIVIINVTAVQKPEIVSVLFLPFCIFFANFVPEPMFWMDDVEMLPPHGMYPKFLGDSSDVLTSGRKDIGCSVAVSKAQQPLLKWHKCNWQDDKNQEFYRLVHKC